MKRIIAVFFLLTTMFSALSAYNPPVGAEKLFEYSGPESLSGNMTVAGGAIFSPGADSIIVNPALMGSQQLAILDLGYTFLHNYNKDDFRIGNAFQAGVLIPTKIFVFTGYLNGVFFPFDEINLGNSISFKGGISKDVSDKLDVGIGLTGGFAWNKGLSWSLGLDMGFNFHYGDLWIFKDFRYGASLLNIGKSYILKKSSGIDPSKDVSYFPNFTLKIGAAGTVFKNHILNIGVATDLSTSLFQNLIWDFNAQFLFKDTFLVSIGESINLRESINNKWSAIPSISFGFNFVFGLEKYEYFNKKDWKESEMTVSTAYKNLYGAVNAYSAGINIKLGMEDEEPPVIKFLD